MEKDNIQIDKDSLALLDGFVDSVCEELHLDNYYATISVSLNNAVRYALSKGSENVVLSYGHYEKGVAFSLSCNECVFGDFLSDGARLTETPTSEMPFLVSTLSDGVQPLPDGRTLRILFSVQGISPRECASRIATLEKFYQPALVEA